ncbi:hypothetical protein [Rhizobium sp. Root708]|uniref:hypothetical protein n=1 Tax=Rhizobium sp. Root708 TaxID=1736592 RepID=UPI000A509A3C|nr:hypothetical protein [Rhizobium sp. Root708]
MTLKNGHKARKKLRMPLATLVDLAPAIIPQHDRFVGEGYLLQASSGIYRNRVGGLSARFVYRPRGGTELVQSFVITVRNIVLDSDTLSYQKIARNA